MKEGAITELMKRLNEGRGSSSSASDQHELDTLIEWERESGAGLEMIREVEGAISPTMELQKAYLLSFRGVARVSRYDIDGDNKALLGGLEDQREAVTIAHKFQASGGCEAYQRELAKALVRCGEQCGDTGMLREAIGLLGNILKTNDPALWLVSDYDLANAMCVAELRLGSATGDRALVENAVRRLQVYLKRSGLSKEGTKQTLLNVIAALAENARQNRSVRVYQQTIQVLEKAVKIEDENQAFIFQYLASLKTELSYLNGDLALVHQAISDFEKSLRLLSRGAGLRLTILHSLAHAHFLLGKCTSSIDQLLKAISRNEEAMSLISQTSGKLDSRVARLIGDRASYHDAIGLLSSDEEYLNEAKKLHLEALSLVVAETAPWLRSKIASGCFYHCCVRGQWEEAIEAFAEVEKAWGIATVDPSLSSEIHDQRALELAPHYARAALCYLAIGEVSMASSVIDRGRAQQLTAACRINPATLSTGAGETDEGITSATAELSMAHKEGDDIACREAWKKYRNILHQRGGRLNVLSRTPKELLEVVPKEGVFVQLFGIDGWLKAIIVDRSKPSFSELNFPNSVSETISRILHGDSEKGWDGWGTAYQRFRTFPDDEDADDEANLFDAWDQTVTHCLRSIGHALMEPIHRFLKEKGYATGSPVILSPPGELASLPLNSVLLEDGTIFSDHWSFSIVPNSVLISQAWNQSNESLPHRVLIVSEYSKDRHEHEGPEFLSFASTESNVVASHVAASNRTTLGEAELNLVGVLKAQQEASIVHFACHGAQHPEKPDLSGLSLPGGDVLTLARLRASPNHGQAKRLAVLSCCETGISGRTIPADEFVGLLPTMLQAGFQGAVGTLWPVYDDSAMCLMDRFYRLFLAEDGSEKCSPAEALAQARAWLRVVTIGELVECGLFTSRQALQLAEFRFAAVRLRIQPVGQSAPSESQRKDEAEEEKQVSLTSKQLQVRPFSSPVDWAPFILVGT